MEDEVQRALDWHRDGHAVAMATVVRTWGSSPRPAGSHLVVRDDMRFAGSVSGGCVEGAVVQAALEVMEDERPRMLSFGVSDAQAWEVGLACGGRIEVRVAPLSQALMETLQARRAAKEPVVLATHLEDGRQELRTPEDPAAATALRQDRAQTEEGWFLRPYNPPLRLVIVGAVHIAQSLARMATECGYAVHVVEARRAFAASWPLNTEVSTAWPDDALRELAPDVRTAVVLLTHDPKLDDPALEVALGSDCFYIGALGSRRTHAARLDRLRERGFDEAALARIHGPLGLPIGSRSPSEIALSAMAQITAVLRQVTP
jgi:xanthine dehydrogenase accessory factor